MNITKVGYANSHKNKRKISPDRLCFNIIAIVIVFLLAVVCILPFYLIIVASFTDEGTIIREGYTFFVKKLSTEGYHLVLKNPTAILKSYGVTLFVTVVGTSISLIICVMTGYVLSRKDFPWRNSFSFYFFFTTLFGGGLVPWYLLCTKTFKFTDSILGLIVPSLFSVWNMIISKNFIKTGIPFEIIESVKLDGANDFTIFTKIVLPLSKPLLATIGLFTALGYWNDWYNCMLFIRKNDLFTLQYYLQTLLNSADGLKRMAEHSGLHITVLPMESMKMAMTVVATGPIILLYPFLQKYFVKGLTIGAVKG